MPDVKRREQCKSSCQTSEHTSLLRSLWAIVKSEIQLFHRPGCTCGLRQQNQLLQRLLLSNIIGNAEAAGNMATTSQHQQLRLTPQSLEPQNAISHRLIPDILCREERAEMLGR